MDGIHYKIDKSKYWNNLINLVTVLATAIIFNSFALGDEFNDCNGDDLLKIISGCSQIIEIGDQSDELIQIAYSRRSDAYIALRDFDNAVNDRAIALSLAPPNQEYKQRLLKAITFRADAFFNSENYEKAIGDYTRIISQDSENLDVLIRRSEAYFKVGNLWKAIDDAIAIYELNRISVHQQRLVSLYELKANELTKGNSFNSAIALYMRAIDLNNKNRQQCNEWVETAKSDIFTLKTPSYCKSVIRINRGYIQAITGKIKKIIRDGDYSRALEITQNIKLKIGASINISSYSPHVINLILLDALSSENLGNYKEAYNIYDTILLLDSDNVEAKNSLNRLKLRIESITRLLQIKLTILMCNPGPIDGIWGERSRYALDWLESSANIDIEIKSYEPTLENLKKVYEYRGEGCMPFE